MSIWYCKDCHHRAHCTNQSEKPMRIDAETYCAHFYNPKAEPFWTELIKDIRLKRGLED